MQEFDTVARGRAIVHGPSRPPIVVLVEERRLQKLDIVVVDDVAPNPRVLGLGMPGPGPPCSGRTPMYIDAVAVAEKAPVRAEGAPVRAEGLRPIVLLMEERRLRRLDAASVDNLRQPRLVRPRGARDVPALLYVHLHRRCAHRRLNHLSSYQAMRDVLASSPRGKARPGRPRPERAAASSPVLVSASSCM